MWPELIGHALARAATNKSEEKRMTTGRIHFLFFSCGSHMPYLELALRSLERVRGPCLGRIFVGEDPDDPIGGEGKARLKGLGSDIVCACWGKVTGYGVTTVVSELAAFRDVAAQVDKADWIAKVDSDVLFLNDKIFRRVTRMNSDLVGHEELAWRPFAYSQGGCYFLRAAFVPCLDDLDEGAVTREADRLLSRFHDVAAAKDMWKMPQCPEDALIHRLVTARHGRIKLEHYYLPLWQLQRLVYRKGRPRLKSPALSEIMCSPRAALGVAVHNLMLARRRYSVIHFMSCKERMPEVFTLLKLGEIR